MTLSNRVRESIRKIVAPALLIGAFAASAALDKPPENINISRPNQQIERIVTTDLELLRSANDVYRTMARNARKYPVETVMAYADTANRVAQHIGQIPNGAVQEDIDGQRMAEIGGVLHDVNGAFRIAIEAYKRAGMLSEAKQLQGKLTSFEAKYSTRITVAYP